MPFRFRPATEDRDPLTVSVAIAGGSGTGKTYSALRLARGLAEGRPFGVIDTENRRALHYRRDFPEMQHLDLSPMNDDGNMVGFTPDRMMEAITAAEDHGLPVLVIDSWSHVWSGIGGVLERQAKAVDRMVQDALARGRQNATPDHFGQLGWAEVKPPYRRLIDRIVRAKCHTVICMRAKPVIQRREKRDGKWVDVNATKSKFRRDDIPWTPDCDGDLPYEMTATMVMVPEQPGIPIPLKCADQFVSVFDGREPVSEEMGAELARWSVDDGSMNHKALFDTARAEARKGKGALQTYWSSLDKAIRAKILPIKDELVEVAVKADDTAVDRDELFDSASDPADAQSVSLDGDAPDPSRPSEEQMRAAEDAARQAAESARGEHIAA
ncbi:MAG: AAA family ATPase [Pseudomonadota bacterium]